MEGEDNVHILFDFELVHLFLFKIWVLSPIAVDNFLEEALSDQCDCKQNLLEFVDIFVGGQFFHQFAVVMFGLVVAFDGRLLPLPLLPLPE